jgi:hypothetical protein
MKALGVLWLIDYIQSNDGNIPDIAKILIILIIGIFIGFSLGIISLGKKKLKIPKFKSEKEEAIFWNKHSPLDYPELKEIKMKLKKKKDKCIKK